MLGPGQSPVSALVRLPVGWWARHWQAAVARHPWLQHRLVCVHLPMLVLFACTRAAIRAAGLRFKLDLDWMYLSDPLELKQHLLETIYYFHAFAPGTNLLTGLLLKLAPEHLTDAAAAVFCASGYLLYVSLFQLLKGLALPGAAALLLTLIFSVLPPSIYLENVFLYTHLCASLLCAAAVLFQRALRVGSSRSWLWFFLSCAVLGWLYTTFHLFWFVGMVLGALVLAARGSRRRVLVGALAPALLLLALYVKNYAVFGVFGATSWGGANLTLATTQRMKPGLRDQWIREGKLSPYASISVFAPPDRYLRFLPRDLHFPWPGSNDLYRPSVHGGNYNHGLFLAVNRQRREDSVYYIKARPLDYLGTVLGRNLPGIFSSTTHWHPRDRSVEAPHYQHRQVLGGYERIYDLIVHRFPFPPVGLYVFFPAFWVWAVRETWRGLRSSDLARQHRAVLLGFCLFQLTFVISASCLFSSLESARYRYAVEPCIWGVVAAGLHAGYARLSRRRQLASIGAQPEAAMGSS